MYAIGHRTRSRTTRQPSLSVWTFSDSLSGSLQLLKAAMIFVGAPPSHAAQMRQPRLRLAHTPALEMSRFPFLHPIIHLVDLCSSFNSSRATETLVSGVISRGGQPVHSVFKPQVVQSFSEDKTARPYARSQNNAHPQI
jgi:hypothetical protein